MNQKSLSIIIPVFNCPTIRTDLTKLDNFLSTLNLNYEIICVVDGLASSHDQTFLQANAVRLKSLKVFYYPFNQGKGFAIRFGFHQAKGDIIGFFDAGSDIKVDNIKTAFEVFLSNKADIVVGSKRHLKSKIMNYPKQRRILSSIAQASPRLLLGLRVTDTQVGLKLFTHKLVKQILPKLSINGFAFDLELLTVATKSGFNKIYESPVEVMYNRQSTIKLKSLLDFLLDYARIVFKNI